MGELTEEEYCHKLLDEAGIPRMATQWLDPAPLAARVGVLIRTLRQVEKQSKYDVTRLSEKVEVLRELAIDRALIVNAVARRLDWNDPENDKCIALQSIKYRPGKK